MTMKRHDDGMFCPSPATPCTARHPWCRRLLEPQSGQSLTEFSLVLPIFLLVVMAIAGFGIVFEKKISMDNAARTGARYAAVHPNYLTTSASPNFNTIEGQIQNDGSTITIPNTSTGIQIQYYNYSNNSTATTLCGHFDPGVNTGSPIGWVNDAASATESTCMQAENLVKVTLTATYQLPMPFISALFPSGITIKTSSTMMIEQACDTSFAACS